MRELIESAEQDYASDTKTAIELFDELSDCTQLCCLLDEVIRLRKERGVTQSALAELAGIGTQAVSRLESRTNGVTLKIFCGILDELGHELAIVAQNDSTDIAGKMTE